jgi:hypothetical protein
MPPVDEPVDWPLWKVTEGPFLAVSAISGHADFRVLHSCSTIQSGTRSCGIVYNGSRPISELELTLISES